MEQIDPSNRVYVPHWWSLVLFIPALKQTNVYEHDNSTYVTNSLHLWKPEELVLIRFNTRVPATCCEVGSSVDCETCHGFE